MIRTSQVAVRMFLMPAIFIILCPLIQHAIAQIGPGISIPASSAHSDQKTGSVLIYNAYTSNAANPSSANTDISITNTNTSTAIAVHLFFVNSNGRVSDNFVSLAPKQTMSFLASDYDPGTTGFIVAVAVDPVTGCPISFNHLIGDAYIKFSSGHSASLHAVAFSALYSGAIGTCSATSAVLNFDDNGVGNASYNRLPRALMVDSLPSRINFNDTMLILNRIGGNYSPTSGALAIGSLFGILFDDSEGAYSFSTSGAPQLRFSFSSVNPRLTPRYDTLIPSGRTGWLKTWPFSDVGVLGAVINNNTNLTGNSSAGAGGHNLRALTLSTAVSLTIPVYPPSTETDLAVSMSHTGDFNIGTPAKYTVNVSNVGTKPSTGTITIFDTLPANLTLASGTGTGWSCTGTGTANVVCSNGTSLAAGASLPPLTLNVNVGAGTPNPVGNIVMVANAGDNNSANDQAQDTANVGNLTPTTTTVTSSPNPSDVSQLVTYTATVTGTGGTPTGTVEFRAVNSSNVTTVLGTSPLVGNNAVINDATLPIGLYTIAAIYSGDSSYAGSTGSSPVPQQVNLSPRNATTTTLVS